MRTSKVFTNKNSATMYVSDCNSQHYWLYIKNKKSMFEEYLCL